MCIYNGVVFTLQKKTSEIYHMCMTFIALQKNPNSIIFVAPFTSTLIMVNKRYFECLWNITMEDKH